MDQAILSDSPQFLNDDDFGNWLSGFTDGEGCFRLKIVTHKSGRAKGYVRCKAEFIIALRIDDEPILQMIRSYFGCGSFHIDLNQRKSENTHPALRYVVGGISHCHSRIVPHFEKYLLRAKKANDFQVWKQGVALCYKVHRRVQRRLGWRYGTLPKWLPEEKEQFSQHCETLKEVRSFKGKIPTDLPDVCLRDDQLDLF